MSETERLDNTLVLVDGSSYLFRAFHALPPLTNSRGQPTGVIYGVISMLRRLLADYPTEHFAVVFDAKGETFRHQLYADYKANRPPMPEELRAQIDLVHEVVRALGLPLIAIPGVEADDVIATLAVRASRLDMRTVISSGDKDLAQLVNERVTLVNTMSGITLDRAGVQQKFGVLPRQMIDYLTLVGDSVDNVLGVPKVGPKTAVKWLEQYGSLDQIVAHAGEIGGKIGDNLRVALPRLPLSRELVTLKLDVELAETPERLKRQPMDRTRLRELYQELEFRTLLRDLDAGSVDAGAAAGPGPGGQQPATIARDGYQTLLSEQQLEEWLALLSRGSVFSFDLETDSLNYMTANLVGVSFAVEAGRAAYLPVAHDAPGSPRQLPLELVLARLRPLLEDPGVIKVGQNFKYDMSVLARYGVTVRGIGFDTMIESYVLDSTATRHDMDSLAEKYLHHRTIRFEEVVGKGKQQITFNQVPLEQATPYAAEDADVTLRLHQVLWPRLQAQDGPRYVFEHIDMPLVPVLSRIERNGVLVDTDQLLRQSGEFAWQIVALEKQAHEVAGQPFNLSSPKQIQDILYDRMGLPVLRKTPKGQPSTAEDVLQDLALHYPLPRLILDHRGLAKLKSTYTDKLPRMVNPGTGRVHTSYHQAVASTGRLSSADPNLQNIPIRTAEGRRIRQAFIAPPGFVLVAADYSQIELRIMAHLSQDQGLLEAFARDEDIHRATAAEVFGVSLDEVTVEQRRHAKAVNFGLIYGMSAFGLANQLGVDRGTAQQYIDRYFARYPGVKNYMDQTRELARQQGYVETVFGRRLYLPEIKDRNAQRRQYAERTAINAPMQGSAADLIKLAMVRIDRWLPEHATEAKMIMQVHDELVFEVPEPGLDRFREEITGLMLGEPLLLVPLAVKVGAGKNWDEAH